MVKKTSTKEVATKAAAEVANIQVPTVLVERFKELNISDQEASALLTNFGVPLTEVGPLLSTYKDIKVESVDDKEQQQAAREMRLKLKKIRTGVENTRVEMKEEYNRKGNAIQAVANYLRDEIKPAEEYLQLQEDFIRVQEEKAAAERLNKRSTRLLELNADPSVYSLGDMTEDAFESLVTGIIDANDARAAREKAEKDAADKLEAERKANEEKLAAENAKLKAEADAAAKVAADAKAAADAEIAAANAKAKALQDAAEQKAAQEVAERAAAEKATNDARLAQEAAAKAAAAAPDKDKILSFAKGLQVVVDTRLPNVDTAEAIELVQSIEEGLTRFIEKINARASQL